MKRLLPGIMMGQPSWENMEDERTGICEMFPPCAGNVFFLFFLFSVATNPVSGDSDFFADFDVVFCSDLFVRKSQGIS